MSVLITSKNMAKRDGCASAAQWVQMLAEQSIKRGRFQVNWDGVHVGGAPVQAFVDFGRWMARCNCGQHNYVDPDEAIIFCARCGNGNCGMARPVMFPLEWVLIEGLLLARPVVKNPLAKNEIEDARLAKPVFPFLPRSWYPGQNVADLRTMNSMHGGK